MSEGPVSRRSLMRGTLLTVAAGVVGYVVAANSSAARTPNGTSAANAYGPSPAPSRQLLARVSQIPLGGGIVLASAKVVLSRSKTGDVHGFSAVCTHQGCIVGTVQDGQIICPCHGSRFNAQTGAVVNGPAQLPLPSVPVVVSSGGVYTA
ncbi:MAG TPA: Rieske (2Fe-2S) protein [Acidimicrobiales bacterium]|nr:Rieske (2Fe-2S) protein [Acidimicrobiales bacterium]